MEIFDDMGVIDEALAIGIRAPGLSVTFKNKVEIERGLALTETARGRLAPHLVTRVLTRHSFRRWFLGTLAQLRLHYPDSPLNAEDGSGWQDAPAPGDRAREVDVLINGKPGRIHDVLRGTHHTVLLFTGLDDHARPAVELCRIAERIERAYPGLVIARVISAERFADHPSALGDPDRSAHRQYGIEPASAYVIRPDGHVGYRGRPVGADALMADLAARLPGASPTADATPGVAGTAEPGAHSRKPLTRDCGPYR
ncbi:MAG: hypothetical protein ACRDRW_00480 [Pseudonocardiaceae bacterium]